MAIDKNTKQFDLNYFPVTPCPKNRSVFKDYLDFLIDLKSNQKIYNIFCHSDQDVLQDTTNGVEGERQIQRNHQHNGWFPYLFSKSPNSL